VFKPRWSDGEQPDQHSHTVTLTRVACQLMDAVVSLESADNFLCFEVQTAQISCCDEKRLCSTMWATWF